MSTIVVTLLPVGQGAMNLIEIYDDSRLIHLSLIDCGTDKKPENIDKSVDYVVAKMEKRHNSSTDGLYLDYVLFTHRDRDHWSLFNTIIKQKFSTHSIANPCNKTHFLQRFFSDRVSEAFQGNISSNGKRSYMRTYSIPLEKDTIYAEYTRETMGSGVTDSWNFYNIEQDDEILLLLNFTSQELHCTINAQYRSYPIKARFEKNEKNSAILFECLPLITHGAIPCNYPLNNFTDFWRIAVFFLSELVKTAFPELSLLKDFISFLNEEMFNNDFINYTSDKIKAELSSPLQMNPIVGQFLWGGYKDTDTNKKTGGLTGVGKLNRYSHTLALRPSIELSSFHSLFSPFPLVQNTEIFLMVLECLPVNQLPNLSYLDAASTLNPAIQNNGTSAVPLLFVAKKDTLKFLFTGDATIHTFYAMHDNGMLQYATGAVWTAPHHGSYTTAYAIHNNSTGSTDKERFLFPLFLSTSHPQGMVIESGYQNRYGHPHHTFYQWVKQCFPQTTDPASLHFVYTNTNDHAGKKAEFKISACASPLYSGVTSAKLPTEPDECADLPRPVYMVHQYIADENGTKFTHLERPIESILNQAYNTDFCSEPANYALPAALPPQEPGLPPPPQELFFRRK